MKGKLSTKTIIIAIVTIVLLAVAATGTVLFLKDSGEAAAMEEQNVLPVAGNDNETGSNTEQTLENEETSPETSTGVEQTENESGSVTATTPSQTTGVLTEEPEATTVEQERVVSEETTLGWNNLLVSAEEADYTEIEINYNNLKYTIEYYFDGEIDEELTEVVGENPKGKVIDTYTDKNKVGYKLDITKGENGVEGLPLEISENQTNNAIKVYYVKDQNQVNELTYTVKHVTVNGKTETEVATNTYEENVYVLDEQKITIKENTVKALAEDDERIVGYMLDETRLPEEETGDKVADETVITFYYVKDESQVNELTYTVNHVIVNGETETEVATETYEEEIYVLDEQKITIQENTVKALAEDD
ncbi:MAG: hypothetical protein IJB90_02875, partial [Clostridia bacterium]|nr:hypothetical protein [Clostridia bacterium]